MTQSEAVRQFIRLSTLIGKRIPAWTQGPGGNVSIKFVAPHGVRTLLIKSSGLRLDQVSKDKGLSFVPLAGLRAALQSKPTEASYANHIKPYQASMESGFHGSLEGKYVFHFHSLASILLAELLTGHPKKMELLLKRFGLSRADYRLIPFVSPGLQLSCYINNLKKCPPILLLKNHGIILHSDSVDLLKSWKALEAKLASHLGYSIPDRLPSKKTQLVLTQRLPQAMRPLFPDAAVFQDELLRAHQLALQGIQLTTQNTNQNIIEIWWAQALLKLNAPDISSIPPSLVKKMSKLPSETNRKKYHASL